MHLFQCHGSPPPFSQLVSYSFIFTVKEAVQGHKNKVMMRKKSLLNCPFKKNLKSGQKREVNFGGLGHQGLFAVSASKLTALSKTQTLVDRWRLFSVNKPAERSNMLQGCSQCTQIGPSCCWLGAHKAVSEGQITLRRCINQFRWCARVEVRVRVECTLAYESTSL